MTVEDLKAPILLCKNSFYRMKDVYQIFSQVKLNAKRDLSYQIKLSHWSIVRCIFRNNFYLELHAISDIPNNIERMIYSWGFLMTEVFFFTGEIVALDSWNTYVMAFPFWKIADRFSLFSKRKAQSWLLEHKYHLHQVLLNSIFFYILTFSKQSIKCE